MVERIAEPLDDIFRAISDQTRRAILQQLGDGPMRVTDIAKHYPVSLNAVSKHLIVLQKAGLVRQEIRGRDRICTLDGQPLRRASAWIDEMGGYWARRLDALEVRLEEKRKHKR